MPNPSETLTLADLENWNRRDAAGNYLPSLAVLGHPVAHSVSPQMHNAALAMLAEKYPQLKEWRYFKFQIEPDELQDAVNLLSAKNFKGVNLTVPHKVMGFMLAIASDEARKIGAVNTLEKTSTGGWKAYNTDSYGLAQALKRDLDVDLKGANIVLLGAGGAARAAAVQCLEAGCAKLWIGNRDEAKRLVLTAQLNEPNRVGGFFLHAPNYTQWPEDIVLINATTVGINSNDQEPIKVQLYLNQRARVFDMTFRPNGTTKFVEVARIHHLRATDGLGMLVWQGAKSLSIWLQGQEGIVIKPEQIAQTMMDAACAALGLPHRNA